MNKKLSLSLLPWLLLSLVSCGKPAADAPPASAPAPQAAKPELPAPTADTADTAAAPTATEPAAQTRRGTGTLEEGGAVDIELVLHADHRISGHLRGSGLQLGISGIRDGDLLRCWLAPTDDSTWRGTLMGRGDDTFSGTFTLSDSGGAATHKGQWTAP
ncbi:MAG: hypothetical protein GX146_11700 [Myxococcales bacterium]|jgi:hypothetical protein|nr:hypothetical protein [Myxococcales bacterium]